jgi:hypothetical protein
MSAPPRTRLPLVLLGLMTVASFGGPFAIFLTIRGGESNHWPPDRPVEWWVFGLIIGLVVVLMTLCLSLGRARWPSAVARPKPDSRASSERGDSG